LQFGGNEKFMEYLKYYSLERAENLENKYSCAASQYYRHKLHSFSLGESFDEEQPSQEEGKSLLEKDDSEY
jgi:hypothetical protein